MVRTCDCVLSCKIFANLIYSLYFHGETVLFYIIGNKCNSCCYPVFTKCLVISFSTVSLGSNIFILGVASTVGGIAPGEFDVRA